MSSYWSPQHRKWLKSPRSKRMILCRGSQAKRSLLKWRLNTAFKFRFIGVMRLDREVRHSDHEQMCSTLLLPMGFYTDRRAWTKRLITVHGEQIEAPGTLKSGVLKALSLNAALYPKS